MKPSPDRAAAAPEPAAPERIELRHLEQVLEIVRCGGFSGAARRLGLTQPALSKSIARLEAQIGVRLFERTGGAARPTEYGRLVAERGKALLGGAADLGRALTELAGGSAGRLRIGVGPATRLKPLPEVVDAVLARFPNLQLETRQDSGARIARGVEEGRFDLVFVYSEGAVAQGDLIRIRIFDDAQVFVVRPGHPATVTLPASDSGRFGPRELLHHPWASSGMTPSFSRWVGELSAVEARNATAFVSDDYELIARVTAQGDHVARGPRFLFREALDSGRLVEIPTGYESRYECWMLTTATSWGSPLIKAVAEIAKAAAVTQAGGRGQPPAQKV